MQQRTLCHRHLPASFCASPCRCIYYIYHPNPGGAPRHFHRSLLNLAILEMSLVSTNANCQCNAMIERQKSRIPAIMPLQSSSSPLLLKLCLPNASIMLPVLSSPPQLLFPLSPYHHVTNSTLSIIGSNR